MALNEQFAPSTAQRIIDGMKRIEALPVNMTGRAGSSNATEDEPFIWAEITGESAGSYSWKKLIPDGTGSLQDASPSITGTSNAKEINGLEANIGDRVRLWFIGYDGSSNYRWIFSTGGGIDETSICNYLENVSGFDEDKVQVFTHGTASGSSSCPFSWVDVEECE